MSTKIFVGNLSFDTTAEDVTNFFKGAGIETTNVDIIKRGTRSLGYCFVDVATEETAKQAVEKLAKKELDGRELNIEIAKPRAEGEERTRGRKKASAEGGENGSGRGRRRRTRKAAAPKKVFTENGLFVANLPFSVDDDQLRALFEGLTVARVQVIKKRNGRSKGFGFVEFEDAATRDAGLKKVEGKELEDRLLSVSVVRPAADEAEAAAEE